MAKLLKSGAGWRLGWDPEAATFPGLVGADDWAFELTAGELAEFRRLLSGLADAIAAIAPELMPEEALDCEAEGEFLWLGTEGFPDNYRLRLILHGDRRAEGTWAAAAVPALLQAAQSLDAF